MTRTLLTFCLVAAPTFALGDEEHFSLNYPPSSEKGELSLEANYYLWIPPGEAPLRGVIVHQHGCGDGAEKGGVTASHDLHWQALAKKWNCALMGSSYRAKGASCRLWCDPRNGSQTTFLRALDDFAKASNRPELRQAPWCLWGHSGGAFWASIMQALYPDRIVGVWLRSGTAFERWVSGEIPPLDVSTAAYRIPVMCNPGLKEKGDDRFRTAWDGAMAMFRAYRAKGALIGFAPDPRTAHECGDSRYLAIPFFDACLEMRLPDSGDAKAKLRPVDEKRTWLAPLEGRVAKPAKEFQGETASSVWLPNAAVAKAWSEYVETGAASDDTPPPTPKKVTRLAAKDGGASLRWSADADFESGLRGFIILRDGREFARVPEKPANRFGRPLFQGMSYHDTPTAPLSEMQLRLSADEAQSAGSFQVVAINSVGLQSQPSEAAKPTTP